MDFAPEPLDYELTGDWVVCQTCGTQFPTARIQDVKTCHICDDPRQFVPPSGQIFTTLAAARDRGLSNAFTPCRTDPNLIYIETTPKLGIGQRAMLIKTPKGNILWDCVAYIDSSTIKRIKDEGGLKAIVISHPHYYTTHVVWARAFGCPVYMADEDKGWTTLKSAHQKFITDVETDILPGSKITVIKLGGHFPGSLVLLYEHRLLIADTIVTTPAGIGDWSVNGLNEKVDASHPPPDRNTFSFLWSIPNMIPLSPDEMLRMWRILKKYNFEATHGAFTPMDIEDGRVKGRVLKSMQIQCKFSGHGEHALMKETT